MNLKKIKRLTIFPVKFIYKAFKNIVATVLFPSKSNTLVYNFIVKTISYVLALCFFLSLFNLIFKDIISSFMPKFKTEMIINIMSESNDVLKNVTSFKTFGEYKIKYLISKNSEEFATNSKKSSISILYSSNFENILSANLIYAPLPPIGKNILNVLKTQSKMELHHNYISFCEIASEGKEIPLILGQNFSDGHQKLFVSMYLINQICKNYSSQSKL